MPDLTEWEPQVGEIVFWRLTPECPAYTAEDQGREGWGRIYWISDFPFNNHPYHISPSSDFHYPGNCCLLELSPVGHFGDNPPLPEILKLFLEFDRTASNPEVPPHTYREAQDRLLMEMGRLGYYTNYPGLRGKYSFL